MSEQKTEQKHTPGPWRIVINGTCSAAWPHILGPDHLDGYSDAVAELGTSHLEKSRRGHVGSYQDKPQRFKPSPDHDEVMANARLIAAAPELLDALNEAKRIFEWLESRSLYQDKDLRGVHDKMRAAIAKATGQEAA